jgi:diacylglycerol O-acyltransferase
MADTLTAFDAIVLELEQQSEGAVMNIGAVMVFEPAAGRGTPTIEDVRALVGDRLSSLPRYRQRLSRERPGRWSWPQWIEDERFDIRNHVGRASLPAPGTDAELCDWIADYYSHRLDRTRPLWEMVLLEGLENGRWALAHKLHHCVVDAVGSVGAAELLLDREPVPESKSRSAPAHDEGEPLWRSLVPIVPAPVAQAVRAGGRLMGSGLRLALRPRETLARSSTLAQLLVADELVGATPCSLNVPIGPTRRYAAVQCPMADLTAIRDEFGGSIDDAALAACTTGLRRLLLERDEQLPHGGLRAMVPVNLRDTPESLPIGSLFVELPVAEPLGVDRHRRIVHTTQGQKASRFSEAAGALIDLTAVAPPLVHASLAHVLYGTRLFNLTIASVRGAQRPLYALGARLNEVHPIIPLAANHAVAIAVFSHDGLVTFGISGDCESMPDLGVLAYGIEGGIEELLALTDWSGSAAAVGTAPDEHLTHT